jgi:hypothetical protein
MSQHPETSSGRFLPIRMRRLVELLSFFLSLFLIHNLQLDLSVIKRTDLELTDVISQSPGQPSLHRARYLVSSDREISVIVKIYLPRTKHKKNADLRRLMHILSVLCSFPVPHVYDQPSHSHTHHLIGQSPSAEPSPYLVISDCE